MAGTALLYAATVVLGLSSPEPFGAGPGGWAWPIPFVSMVVVGGMIASKHPRNVTGWLFQGGGALMVANACAGAYVTSGLTPGREVVAWFAFWTWMPATSAITLVLLLFPDGSPPSRGWRPLVAIVAAVSAGTLFAALPLVGTAPDVLARASNPSEVPGGAALGLLGNGLMAPLLPVAFVALVVRYRRATGVERVQMKWFVFGASILALATAAMAFIPSQDPINTTLGGISISVGMTAIPVTAGIAILRYRLYDIDRLISRTVSYTIVVVILGGLYAALVIGLQAATTSLTGGGDVSVAVSTLLAVAAFRPLRERVREAVDHRFNRRRYDAASTVGAFSARMRDQLELDSLVHELSETVARAVQPVHVSVWLRTDA